MQSIQQNASRQGLHAGYFSIVKYNLGKRFQGYALKRKLIEQLGERGMILGDYGHLHPREVLQLQDLPIPGFMYGNFFAGYQLQVYIPHNSQFQSFSLAVKDICDRL